MPIYEYICRTCGKECEILQKISDPVPRSCPHCGERSLRKRVSAAGFRLSGGGWYETDFKTGNKRNLAAEPEKSSDKSAKDGKGKADGQGKADGKADGNGKSAARAQPPSAQKSSGRTGDPKPSSQNSRSD